MLAVYLFHGRRHICASAKVGRQGDQICQRNEGWEAGGGKNDLHKTYFDKLRQICCTHCGFIYHFMELMLISSTLNDPVADMC